MSERLGTFTQSCPTCLNFTQRGSVRGKPCTDSWHDIANQSKETPREELLRLRNESVQRKADLIAANSVADQAVTERAALRTAHEALSAEVADMRARKDVAYDERNRMVAVLTKLFPASLERHPEEDLEWEDDWRWVVYIDSPAGQLSWHIHDRQVPMFEHLPRFQGRKWDGHTTEDKYKRLAEMPVQAAEVAGLREDKARLDWASESVVRIASNDAGGAEVDVFRIVGGVAYPAGEHRAATLRAAIDAARQGK